MLLDITPRFIAQVSTLTTDDYIVMDTRSGRQVMNGKGLPLVLDTLAEAEDVARIMNERVRLLPAPKSMAELFPLTLPGASCEVREEQTIGTDLPGVPYVWTRS